MLNPSGGKCWAIFKPNNHHESLKTSFLLSRDESYHRVRDVRKLLRAGNFCAVIVLQVITVYKDILPAVLIT